MFSCAAVAEAPPRASEVERNWAAMPRGVVDGGEIVILAIKPSMWRPAFDAGPWLALASLLAIALGLLGTPLPGLSVAGTMQAMLLIGAVRLALAVVRWVPSWYVLTNRRVINIQGVRTPRIWACPLVEIRNTYVDRSSAERLTGLGSITFVTDRADESPRVWRSILEVEEVHARVRRAIESAIDNYGIAP